MDLVRKDMAAVHRGIKVIVEIVNMHVPVTETSSRRDVEVSNNLVDSDQTLYATSFLSLRI
jgi:hypothetical protein